MRAKITRRLLDSERAKTEGEVWDTDARGFYARFRGLEGSRWRYRVRYYRGGQAREHVIGEDGAATGRGEPAVWTPETARSEAARIRGLVLDGKDPDAGRETPTLRAFAQRYLRDHARPFKKPSTVVEDEGLLARHILPAFGDVRLDQLDQGAVTRFAQERKDRRTTANRALALLSHIYTKAGEWGVVPPTVKPTRGVPRFREARRERFLSADELGRMGEALRSLEAEGAVSRFALAAIRVLVFTGARPSEILGLTWPMVDLQRGLLNIPDSKTGQKVIHLNPPAAQILSSLPRISGDARVFPPYKRRAAEADLESAWRRVRDRAGLEDVRLYDAARHSFASIAVSSGASLYLVGGLLGHKKATTTQRYAHLSADPLKDSPRMLAPGLTRRCHQRRRRPDQAPRAGWVDETESRSALSSAPDC